MKILLAMDLIPIGSLFGNWYLYYDILYITSNIAPGNSEWFRNLLEIEGSFMNRNANNMFKSLITK